jgi:hypothetical protein
VLIDGTLHWSSVAWFRLVLFAFGVCARRFRLSSDELEGLQLRFRLRCCGEWRFGLRGDVGSIGQCCPALVPVPIAGSRLGVS